MRMKLIAASLAVLSPLSANALTRATAAQASCGGRLVNHVKNEIVLATTPAELERIMDEYGLPQYAPSGLHQCDAPNNWDLAAWGHVWLARYCTYLLAIRGYEMRSQLTAEQLAELDAIMIDAAQESTLILDNNCGVDIGNSCAEDYVAYVATLAAIKNLYPNAVASPSVGLTKLNTLEERYIEKTFSTDWAADGALVYEKMSWDGVPQVKIYNHTKENPVYGGLLFVHMNNARWAYMLKAETLPWYYDQGNMVPLFNWTQTKALADGSAYLPASANACHSTNGAAVACNDPGTAQAIPKIIAAGRFVKQVYGIDVFLPGAYHFLIFSDAGAGGNYDVGRKALYKTYNPSPVRGGGPSEQ